MMTFAVYTVDEAVDEEVLVQGGFATEAEAEEYMAQVIADEVVEYGAQVDQYFVAEEF